MFRIRYSLFAKLCILFSLCFILYSDAYAADLAVSPAYQDIVASSAAIVTYTNQTTEPVNLTFMLQKIIATDLIGRLKFNAPLPQTLHNTDPELSIINPNQLTLNPGQIGTVSASFNPTKLDPGTTAFILFSETYPKHHFCRTWYQHQPICRQLHFGHRCRWYDHSSRTCQNFTFINSISLFPSRFSPTYPKKYRQHPQCSQRKLCNLTICSAVKLCVVPLTRIQSLSFPSSQRLIYGHAQPSQFSWPLSLNRLKLTGTDDVGLSHFSFTQTYLYINPLLLPGIALLFLIFIVIKKKLKSR